MDATLAKLQQHILTLTRQRFGSVSEHADQLALFGSADVEVIEQTVSPKAPATSRKPASERKRPMLPKILLEWRIEGSARRSKARRRWHRAEPSAGVSNGTDLRP